MDKIYRTLQAMRAFRKGFKEHNLRLLMTSSFYNQLRSKYNALNPEIETTSLYGVKIIIDEDVNDWDFAELTKSNVEEFSE